MRVALAETGWRRLVVWECARKGKTRLESDELIDRICAWICGDAAEAEIAGRCM